MIILNALLTPNMGLMFWTIVVFLILLLILRKFAWKPIISALRSREESIEKALNEAKTAREEIADLKAENDRIIKEAKLQGDRIIKEAKDRSDSIIKSAQDEAKEEQKRILAETRELVIREKDQAVKELKNEIGELIVETTAKIVRKELINQEQQRAVIEDSLKHI